MITIIRLVFSSLVLFVAFMCLLAGAMFFPKAITYYSDFYYAIVVLAYGAILTILTVMAWVYPSKLVMLIAKYVAGIYLTLSILNIVYLANSELVRILGTDVLWFMFSLITTGGCTMIILNLCERKQNA